MYNQLMIQIYHRNDKQPLQPHNPHSTPSRTTARTTHDDNTPCGHAAPPHARQATAQATSPHENDTPQGISPPAVSQGGANNEEKRNGQQHGTRNETETIRNPMAKQTARLPSPRREQGGMITRHADMMTPSPVASTGTDRSPLPVSNERGERR